MYSKVIQLYIYVYLFFFQSFPHLGYYKILSIFPCTTQQVLFGYSVSICVCVIFIWLLWVLVAPHGLLDHHCRVRDLSAMACELLLGAGEI